MRPLIDGRKAAFVLVALTAIGCQTQRPLTIGVPDPGMIGKACTSMPPRILLPCTVTIRHSDARRPE